MKLQVEQNELSLNRWLFMIQCYFDDSGKESSSREPFVCLAGYLGHYTFWERFINQWQHMLMKHNISCIHMRDMIPLTGEYGKLGWDEQKRDKVLLDFIDIIKDNQLIGFGVGVDVKAWRIYRKNSNIGKSKLGDVQYFCFARIMRMLTDRLSKALPHELVSITFDTDPEFAANRLRFFQTYRAHNDFMRKYMTSITFADPLSILGLQAADILAWETRKDLIQKLGGYNSNKRYQALITVLPGYHPEYISEFWDDEEMRKKFPKIMANSQS